MGLTRLATYDDAVEAEMVCGLLRQYGVRCVIDASGGPGAPVAGALGGVLGGALASLSRSAFVPHTVLVHEDDAVLAQQVLAAPVDEEHAEPGV